MNLKHLNKIDNVAFFNFAATNAVAGVLANVKGNDGIKGKIKHQFNTLWNHVRQLMNVVDKEAARYHVEKMKQLPPEQWTGYVELTEGYDDLAEAMTTFVDTWMEAQERGCVEAFMSAIEAQAGLWAMKDKSNGRV